MTFLFFLLIHLNHLEAADLLSRLSCTADTDGFSKCSCHRWSAGFVLHLCSVCDVVSRLTPAVETLLIYQVTFAASAHGMFHAHNNPQWSTQHRSLWSPLLLNLVTVLIFAELWHWLHCVFHSVIYHTALWSLDPVRLSGSYDRFLFLVPLLRLTVKHEWKWRDERRQVDSVAAEEETGVLW